MSIKLKFLLLYIEERFLKKLMPQFLCLSLWIFKSKKKKGKGGLRTKLQDLSKWMSRCDSYFGAIFCHLPLRVWCTGLFEMIVVVLTTATSFSRCNPMWLISMALRQGSDLCSSSSRKYPGSEGTNQNRYWSHHRWHATNSLERTGLSCWCL